MLIVNETPRVWRKRERPYLPVPTPAPPAAPVLVSVSYVAATSILLQFDRAIHVGGLSPSAFAVHDGGDNQAWYRGASGGLIDATTLSMDLSEQDPWDTPGVTLTVTAGNGITAADTGTAWAGVSDLLLPFP